MSFLIYKSMNNSFSNEYILSCVNTKWVLISSEKSQTFIILKYKYLIRFYRLYEKIF